RPGCASSLPAVGSDGPQACGVEGQPGGVPFRHVQFRKRLARRTQPPACGGVGRLTCPAAGHLANTPGPRILLGGIGTWGDCAPPAARDETTMNNTPPEDWERFRAYLQLLAQEQLRGRPPAKLGASDLVQQTLLEAHRGREQFRGTTDGERAAWLRQILARN